MLLAIYLCAAALILLKGLFVAINNMGRHTPLRRRLAWLLLTTAALDAVVGPAFARAPVPTPGWAVVALTVVLACYVLAPWRAD